MKSVINGFLLIVVIKFIFGLFIFYIGEKSPNKKFIQTNEVGHFDYISKYSYDGYDIYRLYIEKDNKIKEKKFRVNNSKIRMAQKGEVVLEIKTNQEKNSYDFDFNKNVLGVYNGEYKNKITIYFKENTEIKNLNIKE